MTSQKEVSVLPCPEFSLATTLNEDSIYTDFPYPSLHVFIILMLKEEENFLKINSSILSINNLLSTYDKSGKISTEKSKEV